MSVNDRALGTQEAAELARTVVSTVVGLSLADEVLPKDEIVCIVGSREVGQGAALREVREILSKYDPEADVVISGGRGNVDLAAEEVAKELGFKFIPFLPWRDQWMWYQGRNWSMAAACTVLYRITVPRAETYGSGWTRDRAREMGKPTFEVVV